MTNEECLDWLCRLRSSLDMFDMSSRRRTKYMEALTIAITKATSEGTNNESKCRWIKYDYKTVCPQNHDINNPYWRIPENRMDTLKYCPYCGKEIDFVKE